MCPKTGQEFGRIVGKYVVSQQLLRFLPWQIRIEQVLSRSMNSFFITICDKRFLEADDIAPTLSAWGVSVTPTPLSFPSLVLNF
jgi:hypothetical protein